MMTRRVYLYAFDHVWRIVDCRFLEGDAISVGNILRLARWMRITNPEHVTIYAVDNRPGLYKEFRESIKTSDFTKQIEFADTVSHEGLLIQ